MIIGLGSGRCGTHSLAELLGLPHEFEDGGPLPWATDLDKLKRRLAQVEPLGGDVAYWWLNYVKPVIKIYGPHVRFICLQRDKAETTTSRMHCYLTRGVDRLRRNKREYDKARPTYPDVSLKESCDLYWDEYYAIARQHQAQWPKRFKIFRIENLNSERGVSNILKFARSDRKPRIGIHVKAPWTPINETTCDDNSDNV